MTNARYRLVHKLGVGGMAEVFLAQQRGLAGFEKLVVIKRVLPQLRQDSGFVNMLLAEARLAAGLRHPNIVEIYDVHRDEGDFFIVMEYLAGEDLRLMLATARKAGFRFPVGVAGRIISDASAGLDFAHRAVDADGRPLGVVHRDIGPTNIILTYHGISKVLDFGVARRLDPAARRLTQAGGVVGTPYFMSPEQMCGEAVDGRTDLWALGVVLFYGLAGILPFRNESYVDLLKDMLRVGPASLQIAQPELDPRLAVAVEVALAPKIEDRYPDAASMRAALEAVRSRRLDHLEQATLRMAERQERTIEDTPRAPTPDAPPRWAGALDALEDEIRALEDRRPTTAPSPESTSRPWWPFGRRR
ncbi:MAG: serine/threonine protein kinase [Myxococcales bacterium]|nr:serine/threonine protein kinase [Myxococcales bacterium]